MLRGAKGATLITLTVISCCGVFMYNYLSQPLADFVPNQPKVDNSTFGNVDEILTTHFHLDIAVDFDNTKLVGTNTLDMQAVALTDKIVLDVWKLDVSRVELVSHTQAVDPAQRQVFSVQDLDFKVMSINENIGDTLIVQLPFVTRPGNRVAIRVTYETLPDAMALSWLTPAQTAGKKLPYLFSQCESINCRTVAPLQDTPAVKTTYSATVTAKSEFNVMMSANMTDVTALNDTHTKTSFKCDIPIPTYLMAIVVGDIEYKSLGDRVGVITEPSQMEMVSNELESLPTLLDTAEEFLTPYIWGNYTVVVLPPSFPYGGMENPLLTFASPTIIVGDKSQVYVATHEIAHSWTGNQVTCRNWENFWLNEGFTVFTERKVSGILNGRDFAKVEALLGNSTLMTDMNNYGLDSTYSSIHPVLQGDNPDASFSTIPYEKGF